tara:strand:- start:109151 stop:110080 length:930 start_codon:yes stop_codon:yes gene_type:complete
MGYLSSDSYHTLVTPHTFYNNIQYGYENKETMDIWIPVSVPTTGILIHFHGGGFVALDKTGIPLTDVENYLTNGIAVATVNYPFVNTEVELNGYKKAFDSGVRAVKFLKFNATFLNIDKAKFLVRGSSAGTGIAQHIGYNTFAAGGGSTLEDEDADVVAIALQGPQAGYWYPQWESVVFASFVPAGYNVECQYDEDPAAKLSVNRSYGHGFDEWSDFEDPTFTALRDQYYDILTNISIKSVPTRIISANSLERFVEDCKLTDQEHSPYQGKAIRDALVAAGQEVLADLNGLEDTTGGESELDFIIRKIG